MKPCVILIGFLLVQFISARATEFHVATNGNDSNRGSKASPLRTIQRAADLAQPGDVITVHAGTYRERVNPPRGGTGERKRIVYQAAKGERVEIKGSEIVQGWTKVQEDVWKVTLPNSFFGGFNPFNDLIRGDWFDRRGRDHHTGAVYLNGDWLTEAAKLDEVLAPGETKPAWFTSVDQPTLLNVAWFRPNKAEGTADRVPAAGFAAQQGVKTAPCSEGGECVGWIEHDDWLRYDRVDLGSRTERIEFRAASATDGGIIEIHLDTPNGELLGTCAVAHTGDWQAWSSFVAQIKPSSGVRTLCLVFKNRHTDTARARALNPQLWFAQVNDKETTLWAQFKNLNPNNELVEINVRRTVFYPDQPGRNFITVRGFTLCHAATPWAPPTAEQIGLIGTHWSKGWIIENNAISHSTCSGIALGKHGDAYDNTSADTAEGYVKTIERAHAHAIPWAKANIGGHVVRNNTVSHCEQAGVVGSLGCSFSTVTGNVIHDIHVRRLFSGAEMAGIKFHAAIDSVIANNRIFRTCRGLWLDWMAQGTRVSHNLFYENTAEDLFVEVNHGPFVVDNNLFLSNVSLLDMSEGGAYIHNLFTGKITNRPEPSRDTPYHPPHTTTVTGLAKTTGGDDRFYNNIFVGNGEILSNERKGNLKELRWISGYGLWGYSGREFPLQTGGNVYFRGSEPYAHENNPLTRADHNPGVRLIEDRDRVYVSLNLDRDLRQAVTRRVDTKLLGKAKVPKLPYVNADDSPLVIDRDYHGKRRSQSNPTPGPFEKPEPGSVTIRVW
ncbi:MAG TPA: carbohydrate-binding protein [Candidatus Paceibacterota bacterium]|nr:carbohydrate-binding protein [Verrucomicrobiota bacterium]HRY46425.1 carbohydrate-binding protein [Candidatus Paceibacterota bacterium]